MSNAQRASVLPDIIDAMVERFTALIPGTDDPPVTVSDGFATTNNVGDYLLIGTSDPTASSPDTAASSSQEFVNTRGLDRNESGTIGCAIFTVDGSRDFAQKIARDRAFALLAAVEAELRANPTLKTASAPSGIVGLLHVRVGDIRYDQGPDPLGMASLIAFDLTFKARL